MPSIDAFVIGTTNNFSYVTKYVASGSEFTQIFGRDFKYLEQSAKDNRHPTIFSNQTTAMAFVDAGGNRIFVIKQGTTVSTNHIYVMAFGADWNYASQSQ